MNIFNKKISVIILITTLLSLSIITFTTQDINHKEKQSNNDLISVANLVNPVNNGELTIEEEMKQMKAANIKVTNKEEYILIADNKPIRLHNEKLPISRGLIKAQRTIDNNLSNEQVARLVIGGKYGNGDTRKLSIENQGYNYDEVQKEVAKLLESSSDEITSTSNTVSNPITTPVTENNNNKEAVEVEKVAESTEVVKTEEVVEIAEQVSESSTRTMKASAYSTQQKNLSRYTADGTDLIKNPRVVAVDPKVIPLGTKIEIEGYGTYIAADTGGAIKGNRIDIHFKTVQECINFGRRDVKVTIYK